MGLTVQWRHPGVRRSLDVFPDGSGWVACTEDGRIRAYDWERKERWASMRLAYSPDGKVLATISLDGCIELLDAKLARIARLQLPGTYWNAADLAWSTDGTLLAVCSPYSSLVVVSVGKRLKAVASYRGGGSKVAFRPDQRAVLVMREPAAMLLAL